MKLEENAIFIADSHFNKNRILVLDLLQNIFNDKIYTQQIFLMGDIFDFLSNEIEYFKVKNNDLIVLINKLSKKIQIIYLEGNHDFNLKQIFPNIEIYSRQQQPILVDMNNNKQLALAHGDIFTPTLYNIYSLIFRNKYFQKLLNFFDFNFLISTYFETKLNDKSICHKQNDFKQFIEKRKKSYKTDLVIEGHYHQGYIDKEYINIPSYCCDQQYLIYNKNNEIPFNFVCTLKKY